MNQKEATYTAIVNVTGFNGDGVCSPTKEQRAQINMILCEGFRNGKIDLDREFSDSELKVYVSGLISNWLRKDTRLNGGTKYQAKNPGSRAGSGDPQLKAMKALISTLTPGTDDYAEVQACIEARQSEIASEKAKVVVNFDALPEALRAKFGK